ncbi:unnamed protein product [Prunus armeniaca]
MNGFPKSLQIVIMIYIGDKDEQVQNVHEDEKVYNGDKDEQVYNGDEEVYNEDEEVVSEDEESEDDETNDPNFVDNDYEQSETEKAFLKNDDRWFDGYVDHSIVDSDPNVEEDDHLRSGTTLLAITSTYSSSSEYESIANLRRKKHRMPKYEDFILDTAMANLVFKMRLRFANATIFRKAVRIYSANHGRELTFKKNDPTTIRVVCQEGFPFVLHASTIASSTK